MTTASLSGLLTRVGSLTDADVRELEKLADSYPYCQTAHLLLAKALHDRGSVLAGQKLRRAATGAPDRRALRRLLAFTPPETAEAVAEEAVQEQEAPALAVSPDGELVAHSIPTLAASTDFQTTDFQSDLAAQSPEIEPTPTDAPTDEVETVSNEPVAADSSISETATLTPETTVEGEDEGEGEPLAASPITAEAPQPITAAAEPAPEAATTPVLADFDLVPDTAPAAVDLLLFDTDDATPAGLTLLPAETESSDAPTTIPDLAPDPAVTYWLPGSRFGVELVAAAFADDTSDAWLALVSPDARWTEHTSAHQPPPVPIPRRPFEHQFALIDRFLREKPRLRAIDPTRPLPDKLPDLASKSTKPDEGVVSESMARILARQGKTARAVAMYEQLQARLPEKAAIFAAQIAALRGPVEP